MTGIEHVDAYLAACIQGAVRGTLTEDSSLIKMYQYARTWAETEGCEQVPHVLSLDMHMHWDEDDEWKEPYTTPILPTTAAPLPDPIKRAQVEEYLSYLPERTQTILRLRYGLTEDDERAYSVIEIASRLGLTREIVNHAIHEGMAKLRALVEGKATIARCRGRACISYPALDDHPLTETQEALLTCACAEL